VGICIGVTNEIPHEISLCMGLSLEFGHEVERLTLHFFLVYGFDLALDTKQNACDYIFLSVHLRREDDNSNNISSYQLTFYMGDFSDTSIFLIFIAQNTYTT
jgi:hypothetical protein